jgi:hypothetical protein
VFKKELDNNDTERLNDEFPGLTANLSNFCFGFYLFVFCKDELATFERFAADILEFDIPAFLDFIDET